VKGKMLPNASNIYPYNNLLHGLIIMQACTHINGILETILIDVIKPIITSLEICTYKYVAVVHLSMSIISMRRSSMFIGIQLIDLINSCMLAEIQIHITPPTWL
jgi:hypothetical protein